MAKQQIFGLWYPGNSYGKFCELLGFALSEGACQITVLPEQWRHSECLPGGDGFGPSFDHRFRHFIVVTAIFSDGRTKSFKDFCFQSGCDPTADASQREGATMIRRDAQKVVKHIKKVLPDIEAGMVTKKGKEAA